MGIAEDNWTKEFKKVEFYEGFPDWMLGMIAIFGLYLIYSLIVSPLSMLLIVFMFFCAFGIGKIAKKVIAKVLTTNT